MVSSAVKGSLLFGSLRFTDEKVTSKPSASFESITKADKLISYLDDSTNRFKSSEWIHHYTSFKDAVNILNSGYLYLSTAKSMNDRDEYKHGDRQYWNNLFFSSFMSDVKESIGMWSMYSQPWEQGVKLSIPKKRLSNGSKKQRRSQKYRQIPVN